MMPQKLLPEERVFQDHTGLKLGRRAYEGDGVIYRLPSHPKRLVKIVLSTATLIRKNMRVLKYLYHIQSSAVVKLYDVGSFKVVIKREDPFFLTYGEGVHHYYYYVMDKLTMLPRKGRSRQVHNIHDALFYGARLDPGMPAKVKSFVKRADQLKYPYKDFHEWNILQDKRGSLKFIDLESFMM